MRIREREKNLWEFWRITAESSLTSNQDIGSIFGDDRSELQKKYSTFHGGMPENSFRSLPHLRFWSKIHFRDSCKWLRSKSSHVKMCNNFRAEMSCHTSKGGMGGREGGRRRAIRNPSWNRLDFPVAMDYLWNIHIIRVITIPRLNVDIIRLVMIGAVLWKWSNVSVAIKTSWRP